MLEEEVQDMKSIRRKRQQFLQSLFKFLTTTILLGLFLSSPLWLPFVFSFVALLSSMISATKCLFLACNAIIVVLFVLSKLSGSTAVSSDLYEEYVSRNKILQRPTSTREEYSYVGKTFVEESDEGEKGLDELNRRVEDFIAKVNKQRKMEARREVIYI